jgi:carboxylesterase
MEASLGVLILHGFTGSRATVAPVVPRAEALGLPWRLPQLRGHWTQPSDLAGVTYADLREDAGAALDELRGVVPRVALVGLSVGGLLALNLALDRPADIDSLVVLAPALRYVHPLAGLAPLLARFIKTWSGEPGRGFADPSLAAQAGNYASFPTATFASIYRAGQQVEARLPQIAAPLLAIGARQDRTVQPRCAQIVYDRVGSTDKELVWFERSGHELLLDCEADAVADRVGQFLRRRAELAAHALAR